MTTKTKISAQDIIDWSKPHKNNLEGAKHTILETKDLTISIVGGSKGLYGDFVEDFEIAIWENKNQEFRTKFFFPDSGDDVLPYQSKEQLEEVVNLVIGNNNFQVK